MTDNTGDRKREEILKEIWYDRICWSDAAGKLQSRIKFWRVVQMILAVAGAVLATAAATGLSPTHDQVLAAVGAMALLLVPIISTRLLPKEIVDGWPRARSVSEGLKSETFKFRAAVGEYANKASDDADPALAHFVGRTRSIKELGKDLAKYLPSRPSREKAPPGQLTPESYLTERVNEQIEDYYRIKAEKNKSKAAFYRTLSTASIIAAAVASGLAAFNVLTPIGAWAAVATTVGTIFATHSAVNRFDKLASSYAQQAGELRQLTLEWRAKPNPSAPQVWSDFVIACEEAISAENRSWMARMMEDVKGIDDVIKDMTGGK